MLYFSNMRYNSAVPDIFYQMSWRLQSTLDCEIPRLPDTLLVLLARFASTARSTVSEATGLGLLEFTYQAKFLQPSDYPSKILFYHLITQAKFYSTIWLPKQNFILPSDYPSKILFYHLITQEKFLPPSDYPSKISSPIQLPKQNFFTHPITQAKFLHPSDYPSKISAPIRLPKQNFFYHLFTVRWSTVPSPFAQQIFLIASTVLWPSLNSWSSSFWIRWYFMLICATFKSHMEWTNEQCVRTPTTTILQAVAGTSTQLELLWLHDMCKLANRSWGWSEGFLFDIYDN